MADRRCAVQAVYNAWDLNVICHILKFWQLLSVLYTSTFTVGWTWFGSVLSSSPLLVYKIHKSAQISGRLWVKCDQPLGCIAPKDTANAAKIVLWTVQSWFGCECVCVLLVVSGVVTYLSCFSVLQTEHGDDESQHNIEKLMPNKIKKRRKVTAEDGVNSIASWFHCL